MTKFTALYIKEMEFLVKFLKIKNFKFIRIKFKFVDKLTQQGR